jgi:DsbC/DsbD-like thiol-disulfide interchange protein
LLPLIVFTEDENIAKISLLTETNNLSEPFYIGIYFDMEQDWYIYWENPGDAGIPVEVSWEVPDGFTISELIYPTPERFDTQGMISFGYKNEAMILAKVTPVQQGEVSSAPVITARVSWMVCKESCILEDGVIRLNLKEAKPETGKIERFKQKLPKSIEQSPGKISLVEATRKENRIFITIHLKGASVDDFFPGPVGNFILSHKDIQIRDKKIEYSIQPYTTTTEVYEVSGLLFIQGTAYRFNETVIQKN